MISGVRKAAGAPQLHESGGRRMAAAMLYPPAPMKAPNAEFTLSKLERVISGPGKIATLGEELERRGLQRSIVVTGKSLGNSPLLAQVTSAVGSRCAAVFKGVRQHVPRSVVGELEAEIARVDADTLIILSGSGGVDTCTVASASVL